MDNSDKTVKSKPSWRTIVFSELSPIIVKEEIVLKPVTSYSPSAKWSVA